MAYDENLAARIRKLIAGNEGVTERKMFGGIAFMLNGNMFCGIVRENLMARIRPEEYEDALTQPHARPMDFTGRPSKSMVFVGPEGFAGKGLANWLERSRKFVETLPPKR